jgi:LPS-assembly protein
VEKENCCWRFRLFGRHYVNNLNNTNINLVTGDQSITGTAQNGLFFQIELKGLTGISSRGDMDKFLQETIYGYRKSQNDW